MIPNSPTHLGAVKREGCPFKVKNQTHLILLLKAGIVSTHRSAPRDSRFRGNNKRGETDELCGKDRLPPIRLFCVGFELHLHLCNELNGHLLMGAAHLQLILPVGPLAGCER